MGTLEGSTLFAGDSITVGVPPFVHVNGEKRLLAEVGRNAAWLHDQVRGLERFDELDDLKNAVVLIGTNDLGSSVPVNNVFSSIRGIWEILKFHKVRVFAGTIPPFKGWPTLHEEAETRRRQLNDLILQDSLPDRVIRFDTALADPTDPTRLLKSVDSGDHLHPKKEAVAKVIEESVGGVQPAPTPLPKPPLPPGITPLEPTPPVPAKSSTNLWPLAFLGAAAVGGIVLWRRSS